MSLYTNYKYHYSLEEVKEGMIKSIIDFTPTLFIPFLLSSNVATCLPNKMRFFRLFKREVKCAKISSKGPLIVKKEQSKWFEEKGGYKYSFYDSIHKFPRISIEVLETDSEITLEILPF